ncbi:4a-hydroxytetrahydrobiopterin dehydratase [Microlunatus speluncae]|uniref:4a-hydroxytetrahydrobiopterin dehydratase n=1 Tax=Microlunatus speluncae TaxID=2594267 RepID=UPI0012662047|nr:4a-hydroxytetrahydrobiopterin dehydratase [Microlunatus speluncae]
MTRLLTDEEVHRQLADLADWSRVEGEPAIRATIERDDFVAALEFVNQVGDLAEAAGHHPDIDIRWNKVTLTLSTHSEGGLTQLDFELAHQIAAL